MKDVIFTEEQLHHIDEIGRDLFCDQQDPRSSAYIRKLKRPPINWIKIFLCIIIPLIVVIAFIIILKTTGLSTIMSILIPAICLMVYIILMLKRAFICAVKIYQRYAPDSIRNKCRFEPSCSEYMILSVEKYGFIKGLKKGIDRLKRCNIDGGGFDFP